LLVGPSHSQPARARQRKQAVLRLTSQAY
jgi:hypothetical protein